MLKAIHVCAATLPFAVIACGGSPDPAPEEQAKADLSFQTGDFQVPPGDSFECFYTDVKTDRELSIIAAKGTQALGGHHMIVYYTDTPREAQHHPCVDSEMVTWHQIAGVSGKVSGEPVLPLPEGLAIKVPADKQLVIQTHYINTAGATQTASDSISLVEADPTKIKAYANLFALVDTAFDVPPHTTAASTSRCVVKADLNVVLALGHMHESGKHYTMMTLDDKDQPADKLYETDWQPQFLTHPPLLRYTMDKPLVIKKGTTLQQTCEWNNTGADPLVFPHEMCVGFFYYFPDAGDIYCDTQVVK